MGMWDFAGALVGAGASLYSNSQATKAQTSAASSGNAVTKAQYDQTREDFAPWRGVGRNALYATSALTGVASPDLTAKQNQQVYDAAINNFQVDPGYQFRLDQGIQALDRSASSRGRLRSGRQDKAITQYGQNVGSQEFGNYYNKLANLAGLGQVATNQTAAYGNSAASQINNNLLTAGNARATGYRSNANIINRGIENALMV